MSISPNMSLTIPSVGTTSGPQFATDINTALTIIDGHDHSTGSGVQITPSGMNINASLSMGNNLLTDAAGMTLTAQNSTPGNGTIYESGNDLYFVDGVGNNVRITQSGGVAGSPGSISNLTSPASASYVSASSTFVWQSNTSIAANLDAGSLLMRNLTPNSTYALTLTPPANLASNFSITLPSVPVAASFLTIDTSGVITGSVATSQGITKPYIAALGQQTSSSITTGPFTNTSGSPKALDSVTITTTGRPVFVGLIHDSSNSGIVGLNTDGTALTSITGSIVIKRDGTIVSSQQISVGGSSASTIKINLPCSSVWHIDTGAAAGSHTYAFTAFISAANGQQMFVTEAKIIAYEL